MRKKNGFFNIAKRTFNLLWQRPQVRVDEDEERKATWLELFFDLIFVAIIARLTHVLVDEVSIKSIFRFILLFVPMWIVWLSATYYHERFEVNDVRNRLLTFIMMIPLAAMAYVIGDAFSGGANLFAVVYITVRIIQVLAWLSAGRGQDIFTRKVIRRYAIGFSISILLWTASIFLPFPWKIVLWCAGLLIDIITPRTTLKLQQKMPKLSKSHLPERFGLFTIIVIAEIVIGVVTGISHGQTITLKAGITAALCLILAFQIWWIYFEHITFRPFKQGTGWIATWSLLHLPFSIAVTAIGAGIVHIVSHDHMVLETSILRLTSGAVGVMLIIMGMIGMTLDKKDYHGRIHFFKHIDTHFFVFKIVSGGALIAMGFLVSDLNPLLFILFLNGIMGLHILQGLVFWVKAHL